MLAMQCQDLVLNQHHPTLDSTSHLSHAGGGLGLPGAYLGDAMGFGDGEGRVSKSVFGEEWSGHC